MNRRVIFGVGVGFAFAAVAALVGRRQCAGHEARGPTAFDARERRGARGKRFLDDIAAIRDNTDRILEALDETRGHEHELAASA